MRICIGTYRLNFFPDFLKLFFKTEKLISFVGIYIFFQLVPRNKSYAQIRSKQGREGSKINFVRIWIFFIEFFTMDYIIFLSGKLLFIPFGFVMRKLWTISFFRYLKHLAEKINL